MTVTLNLDGTDKLLKQFRIEEERISDAVAKGMAKFGGEIIAESVKITPYKFGNLRRRSYVSGPEYDPDKHQYVMLVGYERHNQTFEHRYAVPVHERTYARHKPGTQAKFLEVTVKRKTDEYLNYMAGILEKELNRK